jgi:hypothetical protein
MEGRFPTAFERKDNFCVSGNFYKKFEKYLKKKKALCRRASLSIGPCWRTWRGSFTGIFERIKNSFLGSSAVDPEDIKS